MTETARYHGSFICVLLERVDGSVTLRRLKGAGGGYYLINEAIAVCLKWSSKRTGPWTFNFASAHQQTLKGLRRDYGEVYICFICGRDGIAGLSMDDLAQVTVFGLEDQRWVSVRRRLGSMYEIAGPDGTFGSRVGRQAVFERLAQAIVENGAK